MSTNNIATNIIIQNVTKEYLNRATPRKGLIIKDKNFLDHRHLKEIEMAHWIHDTFGGNIRLLNESDEIYVKTSDFEWNDRLWELKNISTIKSADHAIRCALKQILDNPGGIILDCEKQIMDIDTLNNIIINRYIRSGSFATDIMILMNRRNLVRIYRYKK